MASSLTSARSIKEIENLLLCDVCKKTINEPKILPCFHSFCKTCLEKLVTQDKYNAYGKGKKLNCPTCGSKTTFKPGENVAGLGNNDFAIKLLGAVGPNRRQEASVCSLCDIKEASIALCMECELLLCQWCCGEHDKWPTHKNHILLSLDEIINRDEYKESGAENLSCTKHEDATPKFYCETCRKLICMKCVASFHKKPDHTCVAVHEIYRKQQDTVKTKCDTINAMLMQGKQVGGQFNARLTLLMGSIVLGDYLFVLHFSGLGNRKQQQGNVRENCTRYQSKTHRSER